jgi:hypothetical protein
MKVLDSMLKQVQRSHKLDSTELSLSNALTKNFDAAIRRQLDAIWNTVPQSTQGLVREIRTVQSLLTYLLRFNCVSFLRYLQCLRAAAGPRTEWMLHSAASTVFQVLHLFYLLCTVVSICTIWLGPFESPQKDCVMHAEWCIQLVLSSCCSFLQCPSQRQHVCARF